MRRNPKRDALLAEVKARQRAAGKKVSRLEGNGVAVRGTGYDPRVSSKDLGAMNARELRRYLNKINLFVSRGNQFEAGFAGAPIPRQVYQNYKALEQQFNAKAAQVENNIKNIELPGQNLTIGQMLEQRNAPNAAAAGSQSRIFQGINRPPSSFDDVEDIKKLIDNLKKKNSPKYLREALKPRLNSLFALLENSGNTDFIDRVNALTDEQKNILVDYSTFAQIAQERFSSGDNSEVSAEDAAYEQRHGVERQSDIREDLERVFDWALTRVAPHAATNQYRDTRASQFPTQFNPLDTRARSNPTINGNRKKRK